MTDDVPGNGEPRKERRSLQEMAGGNGIACPSCGRNKLQVTNTEPMVGNRIRRRRVCAMCGYKLVTFEVTIAGLSGPHR